MLIDKINEFNTKPLEELEKERQQIVALQGCSRKKGKAKPIKAESDSDDMDVQDTDSDGYESFGGDGNELKAEKVDTLRSRAGMNLRDRTKQN